MFKEVLLLCLVLIVQLPDIERRSHFINCSLSDGFLEETYQLIIFKLLQKNGISNCRSPEGEDENDDGYQEDDQNHLDLAA